MGRHKGCPGGPGRPKATPESRKQYGKTSMSFSITELKVLNRMMRTPWWRQQMRNSGCCKCLKKEPKCQQVHHLFRFMASGFLDELLVGVRDELLDLSEQLQGTAQTAKLSDRLREVAEMLPPNVLGPDPSDDMDFAVQKAQKAEQKEYMRAGSMDDDSLEQELHHLQQRQLQLQQQQQRIAVAHPVPTHLHTQTHPGLQELVTPNHTTQGQGPEPCASLLQQLGAGMGLGPAVGLAPVVTPPPAAAAPLHPGQVHACLQGPQPHPHSRSDAISNGGPNWLQMADMPPPCLPPPPALSLEEQPQPLPAVGMMGPDGLGLEDYAAAEAVLAALASDPQLHQHQQQLHHHHSHSQQRHQQQHQLQHHCQQQQPEQAAFAAMLQPSGVSELGMPSPADMGQPRQPAGGMPCLMPQTPPVLPGVCDVGHSAMLPVGYAAECCATAAMAAPAMLPVRAAVAATGAFSGPGHGFEGMLAGQSLAPLVSTMHVGFT